MTMFARIASMGLTACLALPAAAGGVSEPEEMNAALMKAFNAADKEALAELYLPDSVFVTEPGKTVSGVDDIMTAFDAFLEPGLPLELELRHLYVAGDTAKTISDWVIAGTDKDGEEVRMTGNAIDILRKGPDGNWYFWIDNPHGVD